MKWLGPGRFTMGCTRGQSSCEDDETKHDVSVSGFWMATVETTQRQWKAVTGSRHPSYDTSCGEDCPVVSVNWCEAVAFTNARSKVEELRPAYTLPWTTAPGGAPVPSAKAGAGGRTGPTPSASATGGNPVRGRHQPATRPEAARSKTARSPSGDERVQRTVRLTPLVDKKLRELAEERGIDLNAAVSVAITEDWARCCEPEK